MKEEKNEFLGLLCNLYMVALLAALPLYTGSGYWQLGDTKYMLFRNLSFLCLGGWMIAGMPGRIRVITEYLRKRKARGEVPENAAPQAGPAGGGSVLPGQRGMETAVKRQRNRSGTMRKQAVFSSVDFAMMIYGICVMLSTVCSDYGELAWAGYEGWYMGAVSQLLFIGIYFFISRQYDGAAWPVYLGEAALFLVTLLGLLHRLGIDPLGLMGGWNSQDWEYSHMLSTLGNINWLCGYYSVALAFVIAHFLQEKRRWLQAVLYLVSVAAFVLLLIQGSQSGLLILGTCVALCFLLEGRQSGVWGKVLLLLAGTFFCMPLMEALMRLRGSKAAIVKDGNIFAFTSWYGWMLAAVICLFLFLLSERKEGDFCEGISAGEKKIKLIVLAALAIVTVLAGVLFWRRFDDSFGSGRGLLWRIAVESFIEADGKDKLLGAGPDCYAEAVFNRLGADTEVWNGEHWEGAVFTNAHNEILSQLCNVGILGTVSYLAVFLAGMWRYGYGSGDRRGRERYRLSEFQEAEAGMGGGGHLEKHGNRRNGVPRDSVICGLEIPGEYRHFKEAGRREAGAETEDGTGEPAEYESQEIIRNSEAYREKEIIRTPEAHRGKEIIRDSEAHRVKEIIRDSEAHRVKEIIRDLEAHRVKEIIRKPEAHREQGMCGKTYGQRRQSEVNLTGFCMGGTGVLALAMYGVHSLVSFQQVLNAPLLFLAVGLCEAEMRRKR